MRLYCWRKWDVIILETRLPFLAEPSILTNTTVSANASLSPFAVRVPSTFCQKLRQNLPFRPFSISSLSFASSNALTRILGLKQRRASRNTAHTPSLPEKHTSCLVFEGFRGASCASLCSVLSRCRPQSSILLAVFIYVFSRTCFCLC
jgi:hypothetical protein